VLTPRISEIAIVISLETPVAFLKCGHRGARRPRIMDNQLPIFVAVACFGHYLVVQVAAVLAHQAKIKSLVILRYPPQVLGMKIAEALQNILALLLAEPLRPHNARVDPKLAPRQIARGVDGLRQCNGQVLFDVLNFL